MLMRMQADSSDEEKDFELTAEAAQAAQDPAATVSYAQVLVAVSCIKSGCLVANPHLTNGFRLLMAR